MFVLCGSGTKTGTIEVVDKVQTALQATHNLRRTQRRRLVSGIEVTQHTFCTRAWKWNTSFLLKFTSSIPLTPLMILNYENAVKLPEHIKPIKGIRIQIYFFFSLFSFSTSSNPFFMYALAISGICEPTAYTIKSYFTLKRKGLFQLTCSFTSKWNFNKFIYLQYM